MKAYVFPGQGAQFSGMGLDLYEASQIAKDLFSKSNDILGFDIQKVMFEGTDDELKQTKVTQPAIFLHSTILAACIGDSFQPDMVAGHSLGELSALVADRSLSFEDGLSLVSKRALAMQRACEAEPSTMAAILGLEDSEVEKICSESELFRLVKTLTPITLEFILLAASIALISIDLPPDRWTVNISISQSPKPIIVSYTVFGIS